MSIDCIKAFRLRILLSIHGGYDGVL